MAKKDYYAVLMVHPSAEQFLIEAAYRRLAREYHPDVSNAPNAHQRMVDVNEAYEVLSDPVRRKVYDAECSARSISRQENTRTASGSTSATSAASSQYGAKGAEGWTSGSQRPGRNAPAPPDPADFGITPNYLECAIEGARQWGKRKHLIPDLSRWGIRATGIAAGILIGASIIEDQFEFKEIVLYALFAFLAAEMLIRVAEAIHDARLKRDAYIPKYNPNPAAYNRYAAEYAKYETEMTKVYVSRNWICHSNSFCCGMSSYHTMPKWEAVAKHATPCSHCGYFSVPAKRLPPPFGNGYLPRNVS